MKKTYLFSLLLMTLAIVACGDDDPAPAPIALEVESVTNFEAPGDVYDRTTNPPTLVTANEFQYFDFSAGTEVAVSDAWDIGIKGTTIITNGGISGSGGVQATTVAGIFDDMMSMPDGVTLGVDTNDAYAINKNTDFENRWYSYSQGVISPVPGRVILLKDTEGDYVKIEILCYYRDCPATPTPGEDNGIYTFRYVHQPDGTGNFDFTN